MKTKLPPLPKTGERRLLKLIAFLEKLPPRKFDFGDVRKYQAGCGTVGCAMGHTPEVFPKLVKATDEGISLRKPEKDYEDFHYRYIAMALFGIPEKHSWMFSPGEQWEAHASLPTCRENATPKQVAKMLKRYLELTKEPAL